MTDESSRPVPEDSREDSRIVKTLRRLEVDRAVFYAIMRHGWQFLAGPVTLILIMRYFSPEMTGFYYNFGRIIALQMFFELAMPQTIIVTASHLWEKLQLDPDRSISGDPDALSRLTHLVRIAMTIYFVVAVLFCIVVAILGLLFFAMDDASANLNWQLPWLTLIVASSLAFALIPLLAVLEGCDQVGRVYQMQANRAMIGNVVIWISIPLGAGLWSPAIATIVSLMCEAWLIFVVYRRFFVPFLKPAAGARLRWRDEVWPFQWRVLVKGFFSYLNADLMGPVIFYMYGSAQAGAFGMTWSVLHSLRGACSSWVRSRFPRLGVLVAKQDYQGLDRLFLRVSYIAMLVMLSAVVLVLAAVAGLHAIGSGYAQRLLSPAPTIVLSLGLMAALAVEFEWAYVHAHRQSPYLLLSVLGAILSGILIVLLGAWFGVLGVVSAFLFVNGLLYLPLSTWAWVHLRRKWHAT